MKAIDEWRKHCTIPWDVMAETTGKAKNPETGETVGSSAISEYAGKAETEKDNRAENGKRGEQCGAVTVEAALVMPLVLCVFFTVVFLIKAVFTYGLIQYAISETADEIATTCYVYHISGLKGIHDSARDTMNSRGEVFSKHLDSVFAAYNSLADMEKSLKEAIGQSEGSSLYDSGAVDKTEMMSDESRDFNVVDAGLNAYENFVSMLNNANEATSDPLKELKSIACFIASGAVEDAKNQLFIPLVKFNVMKRLAGIAVDADIRLRNLDVANGFNGLDFTESSFLSDHDENIDIVVRYRIKMPVPIRIIPELEIVQRAKSKAWLGGDDSGDAINGGSEVDDIWSLGNFQRGLKIRRIFGTNLPSNFPVIARYEGGKAVMIKSMDLTAASYQTVDNAKKVLQKYIDELAKYEGQETPWGADRIVIRAEDIKSKELLLVIPKNKLSESIEKMLADMTEAAETKGIRLIVERYGYKIANTIPNEEEGKIGQDDAEAE